MPMVSKGALHKGWIKNTDTGLKKEFQLNPTSMTFSRGSTFAEISSPGLQYPATQFVKGNAIVYPIELHMFDRKGSYGAPQLFNEWMTLLNTFLPPEVNAGNYTKPAAMLFHLGTFTKRCVLEKLDYEIKNISTTGDPTEWVFKMQLRQVGVI